MCLMVKIRFTTNPPPLNGPFEIPWIKACPRSSKQEDEEGEVSELQAGTEFPFAVLPEFAALSQPSEGAFDDPGFGQHGEGMQLIALGHLNWPPGAASALGEWLPDVAALDQHSLNALEMALLKGLGSGVKLRSRSAELCTLGVEAQEVVPMQT